jgi:hypothetical protein
MGIFGEFDVRMDSWEISEGSELLFDPQQQRDPDGVDVSLEVEAECWQARTPNAGELSSCLFFVDGVRRLEVRLVIHHPTGMSYGALGSYGVGAIRVENSKAIFDQIAIGRLLVTGSGRKLPHSLELDASLRYLPHSVVESDADAPLRAIQEQMRAAEAVLAGGLAQEHGLVVLDGPLHHTQPEQSTVLGLIKRIHEFYLPPDLMPVLASLKEGQRTPLFAILSSKRFARYSWFLRLAEPRLVESDLAGLVRLEVAESAGLEEANRLADATALHLPKFAPSRGRDPRSPQNLLPVGALEERLRRHLGHPDLLRRRLEVALLKEVARA